MNSDIEIARKVKLENINEVARKLNIKDDYLYNYGKYIAKIDNSIFEDLKNNQDGKLILVTSTSPTPMGEGKTTISIGLNDALNKLDKNSIVALREPSLGPVFGIKGGATGGGFSQVVPMEDINLHFTGDMHAITSANNLMCAALDNHIMQGNELNIDINKIYIKRCLDVNDRALRQIDIAKGKNNGVSREDGFVITVASEVMAILCLANNLDDLKNKLGNIYVADSVLGNPIFAKDLHINEAMAILLKNAINPNLVQTLEHNPAIIHGGPFANIAHGCNSIIATKMALKLSDYVITEAGFGSDLGALKFFDIKCRLAGLNPSLVVLNTTLKSLKYNGLCPKEEINNKNLEYLEKGISNLQAHIDNMKNFTKNIIVCLNKYDNDSIEEINFLDEFCDKNKVSFVVSNSYQYGANGALKLAEKVIELVDNKDKLKYLYNINDSIKRKIEIISEKVFHSKVEYTEHALKEIDKIAKIGFSNLPVCIAKTQYSITDDAKKLGYPKESIVTVKDVRLQSGAGFIVVYMGNIMTMPGLSKKPSYLNMKIDSRGNISGLF